jgi:hypothetical protein
MFTTPGSRARPRAHNITTGQLSSARTRLSTSLTLYVNPNGSDTNNGLSASYPFRTIQKAIDLVANTIDLNGFNVTIKLADGTHTAGFSVSAPWVGEGGVIVTGNSVTPTNVVVSDANFPVNVYNGGNISIYNFSVQSSAGIGVVAIDHGRVGGLNGLDLGTCFLNHLHADRFGIIEPDVNATWTISGSPGNGSGTSGCHIHSAHHGNFRAASSQTININANITVQYFVDSYSEGDCTFQGGTINLGGHTVTGTRFHGDANAVIYTAGAGLTFFPGTVAGVLTGGAVYDSGTGAWTPVLNFGGATTGITYSVQGGSYLRIGGFIIVQFDFTLSSKGTATGAATITGLPIAATGLVPVQIAFAQSVSGFSGNQSFINAGTIISLAFSGATGTTSAADTNFTNTSRIAGSAIYLT